GRVVLSHGPRGAPAAEDPGAGCPDVDLSGLFARHGRRHWQVLRRSRTQDGQQDCLQHRHGSQALVGQRRPGRYSHWRLRSCRSRTSQVIKDLQKMEVGSSPPTNTMRAIVRYRYGSPDVLELRELDNPVVKDEDVLVRVRASSLNADDLESLYGKSPMTRLATGLRRPRIHGLGTDVAGQVEAVGKAVTHFHPGDEVFGNMTEHGYGAFADNVCAPAGA